MMTATTNGASLEDCYTNIFSLIDLNGIRWKIFKPKDNNTFIYSSIDTHPILNTYAKCIEHNHIAVWRHEPPQRSALKNNPTATSTHQGHHNTSASNTPHHSQLHRHSTTSTSTTPTNPSLRNPIESSVGNSNNLELWIFGYGNQLKLDNIIDDELIEVEDETWDIKGLSYDCRSLLFKALHNLVERCLLEKGFMKLGRWFVKPAPESLLTNQSANSESLTSINVPILDPTTSICNILNNRIKSSSRQANLATSISSKIHKIIESRNEIYQSAQASNGMRHTSLRASSNTYFTTSIDGTRFSLSFSFNFFVHGDCTICSAIDVRQQPLVYPLNKCDMDLFQNGGIVRVALAPYGLNGVLNGVNIKDVDNEASSISFLQNWLKYYPLPKTLTRLGYESEEEQKAGHPINPTTLPNPTHQTAKTFLSNLANKLPTNSGTKLCDMNYCKDNVPVIVEVIVAGIRMRYPSEYVFTTNKPTNSIDTSDKSRSSLAIKRSSKSNPIKPSKLSMPSERNLHDDKRDESETVKVKLESIETMEPVSKTNDSDNKKSGTSIFKLQTDLPTGKPIDKNSSVATQDWINSSNQATVTTKYVTNKYSSNNTVLAPTDLVKLFPTPPSLEQIVSSPSNISEDITNSKDLSILSPKVINSNTNSNSNMNEKSKEKNVFVYKPEVYASMTPSPKWAPLPHINIVSGKSLPPNCVYRPVTKSKQNVSNKLSGKPSTQSSKTYNALAPTTTIQTTASTTPLTDQTNMTSTSHLKHGSPQAIATPGSLPNINQFAQSPLLGSINSNSGIKPSISSNFAPFTLPHQRLFNNLNEINSIQLNLLMSDSVLGVFKDHNFESCTLCVCNMSIRGNANDMLPNKQTDIIDPSWKQPFINDSHQAFITNIEHINECTCGFSAITNRHMSHLSGLLFEDELELTNVLYDPTEMIDKSKLFKRLRLSIYAESILIDDDKKSQLKLNTSISKNFPTNFDKVNKDSKLNLHISNCTQDKAGQTSWNVSAMLDETRAFVIDELKQFSSLSIHPNSSLSKVLLIESFRNDRQSISCTNYQTQVSPPSTSRQSDESTKNYYSVKALNRSSASLRFTDYCEITKNIISKLHAQNSSSCHVPGMSRALSTPITQSASANSTYSSPIVARFLGQASGCLPFGAKNNENTLCNLILRGLQALITPTLSIDPKGALQLLEQLKSKDSKLALAFINRAIIIFSSPIHDWQFQQSSLPENNFDVANLLKFIQPLLNDSIGTHNKLYKDYVHQQQQHIFSSRDSPTGAPVVPTPPCQGPLTWRQFHQAAGRGIEDQCEPQPIPSILVGHYVDRNHLALSPFALKFWDKLLLEPYAPSENLFYVVISPDHPVIMSQITSFFRDLGNTFELHKLGKHTPISDTLIKVSLSSQNGEPTVVDDPWFNSMKLDENTEFLMEKLRRFSAVFNKELAKLIMDFFEDRRPAYDPYLDRFSSSPVSDVLNQSKPLADILMSSRPMNTSYDAGHQQETNVSINENIPGVNSSCKSQTLTSSTATAISSNPIEESIYNEEEASKQIGFVVYIVDPFTAPSINQNLRIIASIGLMRCYHQLLNLLPEELRRVTQLQLISLDSIMTHSRPITEASKADQLKSLSLNVYSRCRKILTNQVLAKSLTGFGPAASLATFVKSKKPDYCISRMLAPPFILAPMKDKQTELGEMFGDRRERSSVLFCAYCVTEDQKWLVASVTNDKGEISETSVINITVHDRLKNCHASIKNFAFKRLMDFIISTISEWMNPWRLVIGKLGRIGHGELREWAAILSKRSLLAYSRQLNDKCRQCSHLMPTETISILSACLVSLEPDSCLRIMPDQCVNDDKNSTFIKSPLNTPEDATVTHILVFPTSASIQAAHNNIDDPLGNSGLDDDLLGQFPLMEDGIEDLGGEDNMDDLFSAWNDGGVTTGAPDTQHAHIGSSNGPLGSHSVADMHQDTQQGTDETLQLLQQPLALGYYVSTAKIGPVPNWFWSTNCHLKDTCPVFLKSSLHIHVPCVQIPDDLLHSSVGQPKKSHQLDSNLTTDVLRYVLEGYNALSWLSFNPKTYDRQSMLPVHMQNLLQLYHLLESFS